MVFRINFSFGFGKKSYHCADCGQEKEKKHLVGFDLSNRGKNKGLPGNRRLCFDCLKKAWLESLLGFSGIAFCLDPEPGWNSYGYIDLAHSSDWGMRKAEIEFIDDFINQNSDRKCSCGERGQFLVCPNDQWQDNGRSILKGEFPTILVSSLCPKHFVERTINLIKTNNLRIDELTSAYGDRGIYLWGEY